MADRTESRILVEAAPAGVLDVIADFDAYPEWTGAVRSAEVLTYDEQGRAGTVRFVLDAGALRDTYTLAYTWDIAGDGTGTVGWTLVEAGVLKAMDGAYRLQARSGGAATDVTYLLSVELRMPMLGMLRRKAEKTIIDTALKELKKRAEG
jgi:ribosome-associated toxin RatA of RatAB toxin-antitoxin module